MISHPAPVHKGMISAMVANASSVQAHFDSEHLLLVIQRQT